MDIVERLVTTTEAMANLCSAPMDLWNEHSNAALKAAATIAALRKRVSDLEREKAAALGLQQGTAKVVAQLEAEKVEGLALVVHIVMGNEQPDSVWASRRAALAHVAHLKGINKARRKETSPSNPFPTIYWRVVSMPLNGDAPLLRAKGGE